MFRGSAGCNAWPSSRVCANIEQREFGSFGQSRRVSNRRDSYEVGWMIN